jgi:hypothetical protein
VLLHELSHIGTDSIGETEEFWENFKYLIKVADWYDMYNPINYDQISYAFHTMNIDQNPYYIWQIADIDKNDGYTVGLAQQLQPNPPAPPAEHFSMKNISNNQN